MRAPSMDGIIARATVPSMEGASIEVYAKKSFIEELQPKIFLALVPSKPSLRSESIYSLDQVFSKRSGPKGAPLEPPSSATYSMIVYRNSATGPRSYGAGKVGVLEGHGSPKNGFARALLYRPSLRSKSIYSSDQVFLKPIGPKRAPLDSPSRVTYSITLSSNSDTGA